MHICFKCLFCISDRNEWVGINGPNEITFDKECNIANAVITNEPTYFHNPVGGDPCLPEKNTKVTKFCKENKNAGIFRTANGECNNKKNPRWGSANSRLERILPGEFHKFHLPTYDDVSKFRKEMFIQHIDYLCPL